MRSASGSAVGHLRPAAATTRSWRLDAASRRMIELPQAGMRCGPHGSRHGPREPAVPQSSAARPRAPLRSTGARGRKKRERSCSRRSVPSAVVSLPWRRAGRAPAQAVGTPCLLAHPRRPSRRPRRRQRPNQQRPRRPWPPRRQRTRPPRAWWCLRLSYRPCLARQSWTPPPLSRRRVRRQRRLPRRRALSPRPPPSRPPPNLLPPRRRQQQRPLQPLPPRRRPYPRTRRRPCLPTRRPPHHKRPTRQRRPATIQRLCHRRHHRLRRGHKRPIHRRLRGHRRPSPGRPRQGCPRSQSMAIPPCRRIPVGQRHSSPHARPVLCGGSWASSRSSCSF